MTSPLAASAPDSNEPVLTWPELSPTLVEDSTRPPVDTQVDTSAETVDVWQYFADNINEFAVAKAIVDHFDAHPSHLDGPDVDAFGLYLRAKVTLKRQHVAFAAQQEAEKATKAALDKAREESRTVRGVLKTFMAFISSVRSAVRSCVDSNPTPITVACAIAALYLMRR